MTLKSDVPTGLLANAAREAKTALDNGWVEAKYDDTPSGYDEHVRMLTRSTKPQLAQRLHTWAAEHGKRWVYGGPDVWSKDELVAACARIYRGEQP